MVIHLHPEVNLKAPVTVGQDQQKCAEHTLHHLVVAQPDNRIRFSCFGNRNCKTKVQLTAMAARASGERAVAGGADVVRPRQNPFPSVGGSSQGKYVSTRASMAGTSALRQYIQQLGPNIELDVRRFVTLCRSKINRHDEFTGIKCVCCLYLASMLVESSEHSNYTLAHIIHVENRWICIQCARMKLKIKRGTPDITKT